jgi:hypothetical protein
MRDCEMLEVHCELVEELLAEANPAGRERRTQPRATFFRPVIVVRNEEGQRREISCFSRDISAGGIGLLHNTPLELGPAEVRVPRKHGGYIELPCAIVWCHPCGDGWFVAGCAFVTPQPDAQGPCV